MVSNKEWSPQQCVVQLVDANGTCAGVGNVFPAQKTMHRAPSKGEELVV